MKLCKDCKHYVVAESLCSRANKTPDYVNGEQIGFYKAQTEREYDIPGRCGPIANWFEPKEAA